MEGLDADGYVIEYAIRERLVDARARARTAALLFQAKNFPRSKRVETRLTALGRTLGVSARSVRAEISHALRGRARVAKRSSPSLSARRGA